jgi:hypothetical protein
MEAKMTTEAAAKPDKPMTQADRRALEKLVRNDFESARLELNRSVQSFRQSENDRVLAEYALKEEKVDAANERAMAFKRRVEDEWRALAAELAEEGFEPTTGHGTYRAGQDYASFSVPQVWQARGKAAALQDARTKADEAYTRAINELDLKRSQVERQVLIASITNQVALDVLDSIPKAAELLQASMEQPREINA